MVKINPQELIGKKYGQLTIQKAWRNDRNQIVCEVKCDCGAVKECLYMHLKSGGTTSCGKHTMTDLDELIGKKYSRLTIISAERGKRKQDKHNYVYVKCQCDCGNIIERRLAALKNGTVQSCGCLHKEKVCKDVDRNLIGQKFGKLTIIDLERVKSIVVATCKCECGNIRKVRYSVLQKGNIDGCTKCQTPSSHPKIDLNSLIGQTYGQLTIKKAWRNEQSEIRVLSQCTCGGERESRYRNLVSGETTTCGKCRLIDLDKLIGQKFGKLTITAARRDRGIIYVTAQCECGNIKEYTLSVLRTGHTKSCGCLNKTADGNSHKRLYHIWRRMQDRCYNEKNIRYDHYGKRGIIVCDEWRNSYTAFEEWALANGYRDDLSIDRINNDGNYEPSNCRWATIEEQANNKSTNRYITINGETKTLAQWCHYFKINPSLVRTRIETLKWDIEKALSMPARVRDEETKSPYARRLRIIWDNMKNRCYNEKNIQYDHYGKRGIIVCDEWRNNFNVFEEWALANGYQDNLSIGRINNDGNYEPSNCRWITVKERNNSCKNNIMVTMNGETKTLAQWCEDLHLSYTAVYKRINILKWDPIKALTTKVK